MATVIAADTAGRIPVIDASPPGFPVELMNQPVYRGFALVGCTVAADGSVAEAWALQASHRAFAEAAEQAIGQWRYAPADGANQREETPLRVDIVRVDFALTGTVISQTQLEASRAAFPDDDGLLPPLHMKPLAKDNVPARLAGRPPGAIAGTGKGEALLEFFIDSEGRVRLPVVLNASGPAQAEAALAAVRGWRFEAPRVEAKPASVRVRWSLTFPAG